MGARQKAVQTPVWLEAVLACAVLGVLTPSLAFAGHLDEHSEIRSEPGQVIPLRLVSEKQFCSRLHAMFKGYGRQNGYSPLQTTLLASNATSGLVREFRRGRATDYINAAALAEYANIPNKSPENFYIPTAGFISEAMGIQKPVTLALSSGELRFIPFAQDGMDLVVIAQNAAALTPARARKVAEVAHQSGIRISVIWVGANGDERVQMKEARSLAWLVAMTGGAFTNLGGSELPCATVL